ncbi:MAG: M90 family metallopeptidase [Alcanivoracaceae bacterium]|jgi:Mlc titration factor MtfA (ptsG expression regulator)|nr:M90 family metallopeptidase [Alcanivoracaceae bacterium]
MLKRWRRWRENRQIARIELTEQQWHQAMAYPSTARLAPALTQRWRDMTLRFLLRKNFYSGAGFVVSDEVRLRISAQATLPILSLGLDWYDDWDSIVVYETAFIPPFAQRDESGLISHARHPLSGEAWLRGPVIFSWEDVINPRGDAHNVVIHEVAHKLDMRSGAANGAPPFHNTMSPARWHEVMTKAWDQAHEDQRAGRSIPINSYGLEQPGEFFSVLSEHFFMQPESLCERWPEVYEQLVLFYQQDPLTGYFVS